MLSLGQKLKDVRVHYNLNSEEFAKKLGLSTRTYNSYEYDERKPPVEFFFNMYTVYDVNLNWLIANDGDKFVIPRFEDAEVEFTQKVETILRQNGLIK